MKWTQKINNKPSKIFLPPLEVKQFQCKYNSFKEAFERNKLSILSAIASLRPFLDKLRMRNDVFIVLNGSNKTPNQLEFNPLFSISK